MATEYIRLWRIKTGQTKKVMVPVDVLGKALQSSDLDTVSAMRRDLGGPFCDAVLDVTRNGAYSQSGPGTPLHKRQDPR